MMGVKDILSPRQVVLLKESVTDVARNCAGIFQETSRKVIQTSRDDDTPWNIRSDETSRLSSLIPVSNPNSFSPMQTGKQDVFSPSHPSIAKRGRNVEPFDASIS